MDVVSSDDASEILKETRGRGTRRSKYSPIYDQVGELDKGTFVVLRGIDKSAKTSLYQGIMRRFENIKMASGRENDRDGEFYTVVIGNADDYEAMRKKARGN